MTRLDSNKNACDVALATCQQNGAAADQAFAAKAVELGLNDADYQTFKVNGNFFRQRFAAAAAADAVDAKNAATKLANSKPAPAANAPAPAAPAPKAP